MAKVKSRLERIKEKRAQLAEEEKNYNNGLALEKSLNELLKKHGFASYEAFHSFMYEDENPSKQTVKESTRTRLNDEDKEKIINQLKAKEPVSSIAASYKVSVSTISKIKADANLVKSRKAN